MRAVTVYRVDFDRKTKEPIGAVLEMRKTERTHNYHDLLRLARRVFALDTADGPHIVIDARQTRRAYLPVATVTVRRGSYEGATPLRMLVAGARQEVVKNALYHCLHFACLLGGRAGHLVQNGRIHSRSPVGGRYLVLGMRDVNLRGASLVQRTRGKEGKDE